MLDKINKNSGVMGLIAILVLIANILLAQLGGPGIDPLVEQGATNFDSLEVGAGSASAPSLTFTDDNDTGVYRVGANNLGFAAGGSIVLDVDGTDFNLNAKPIVNIGNAGTDFDTSGGLTLASGVTLSDGNLVLADWLRVVAQTSITVTTHITPTGSNQPLTASAWVSPTLAPASGFTSGFVLTLINNSANNIYINDTGNIVLTAAWTAGQYDTLTVRSDGTRWIELARANN